MTTSQVSQRRAAESLDRSTSHPAATNTDINGDNYLDTALNEVYYNNTFGQAGTDRVGNPWGINVALPGIDVETVALHENGHSLGLGHFGPPPAALMNPVYAGIRQAPLLGGRCRDERGVGELA